VALTLQPISLVAQPGFEQGMPSCSGMVVAKCHGTLFSRQPLLKLNCPQAKFHKVAMNFYILGANVMQL